MRPPNRPALPLDLPRLLMRRATWVGLAVLALALLLGLQRSAEDIRAEEDAAMQLATLMSRLGTLAPLDDAAALVALRAMQQEAPLRHLELQIHDTGGRTLLAFEPLAACGKPVDGLVLSGTRPIVPSGTRGSCYQEPKPALTSGNRRRIRALNLESNQESNFEERARDVQKLIRATARSLSTATKKSAGPVTGSAPHSPETAPELPLRPRSGGAR